MERRLRRHYTREFKLEAVRLAAVDGRPKAQIARQLGIRVNQLRKWRQEFEREKPGPTRPRRRWPPRIWSSCDERLRGSGSKMRS